MQVGIEVDFDQKSLDEFNTALNRYVNELGKDLKKTTKQWAGNLAVELMKETAPFGKGRSASNGLDARARGREVIEASFNRSITTMDKFFGGKKIDNERLDKLVKRKQYQKVEDTLHAMGYESWEVVPFSKSYHEINRGLLYRKQRTQRILTLDKQAWRKYLKELKERVGYTKAGWAIAVAALGKKVPGWIAKHLGYAQGSCQITETNANVTIVMTNNTQTIGRYNGRYNYALSWLFDKMNKDVEFKLDYLAKKKAGKL